jgi:hypothetical protein
MKLMTILMCEVHSVQGVAATHCVGNDLQLDGMVCSAVFVLCKHKRHRNKICLYNGKAYEYSFKVSVGWPW